MMPRHRRPTTKQTDLSAQARYTADLQRARLVIDAQIRDGNPAAVHLARVLFGADELIGASA